MSMRRWDPFRDTLSLRDAMNRLFEDSVVRTSAQAQVGAGAGLALDIEETGDTYVVRASLPGVTPEDVQVQVLGDTVSIRAERKQEAQRSGGDVLLNERRFGTTARTIALPTRVDPEAAEARFEHGELVLTLPKAAEARPREIPINVQGRHELAGGGPHETPERP